MRRSVIAAVVLFLAVGSASAFDGQRKGFMLGGGIGFAPVASWDGEPVPVLFTEYDESKVAFAANVIIGYGWDEFNLIAFEGNITSYNSDLANDLTLTQGFGGVAWYHYFGPKGRSFFTTTGLGVYTFKGELEIEDFKVEGEADPGFGWLVGAGYEFASHWQIGAYLSMGKTSDPGIDYDHTHFSILVGGIAF